MKAVESDWDGWKWDAENFTWVWDEDLAKDKEKASVDPAALFGSSQYWDEHIGQCPNTQMHISAGTGVSTPMTLIVRAVVFKLSIPIIFKNYLGMSVFLVNRMHLLSALVFLAKKTTKKPKSARASNSKKLRKLRRNTAFADTMDEEILNNTRGPSMLS